MSKKMFIAGNEALGRAAVAAGARCFYGYPITPTSEIAHFWAKFVTTPEGQEKKAVFVQAEDETGAGFMVIGGVLAGGRSFTATAGPGHILMQDSLAMAEAMRLPMVLYVMQRGGPSTATVIYSQQEVNLACFGGNGNGYRVVYSPATLQELYDYGIKVFDIAWKYRFPTTLLGDGYLAKMMGEVEIYDLDERGLTIEPTEPYMLEPKRLKSLDQFVPSPMRDIRVVDGVEYACFRNCLNLEQETLTMNEEIKTAFDLMAKDIVEHRTYGEASAKTLVVAHGIVSEAARAAAESETGRGQLRVFRPVTLRPFPTEALRTAALGATKIVVAESADNQLARFVKDALCGYVNAPVIEYARPSMGIVPEEILKVAL